MDRRVRGALAVAAAAAAVLLLLPAEHVGVLDGYAFTLRGRRLTVTDGSGSGSVVWRSPSEWLVAAAALADTDRDGLTDVNLSVWKAGDFGPSRPFWVARNDMAVRNHFFLFAFRDGRMVPRWQSSNLAAPNCAFAVRDEDGDGAADLVVQEGDYAALPQCGRTTAAVWEWNGWGFTKR